jgi:trehalose 6-phosphate synthase
MSRLVVVSNRVPLPSEHGPRAGGLAVALADAITPGALWFGWSGKQVRETGSAATQQRADGVTYATIDLSEADYRAFYVNFSNGALWPLLHFRPELISFRGGDYKGYRSTNGAFAHALAPLLRDDDLLWIHDYHHFPLAADLRALGVKNPIGFFLHTPFVPPALLQVLPCGAELLGAMCAYDLIGFHTETYRQAFLDCVAEILGISHDDDGGFRWRGRRVRTLVDPVGIDAVGFARLAEEAIHSRENRQMLESLPDGRTLAIGVDRMDYSKGLVGRFEAIGKFFETYPEHRRHVSFLQVAAKSREDQQDYRALQRQLHHIVGDTNGRFSEFDWVPLRYMTRAVRRSTLAGFYRIARLAIVTPLRDGMNLVAKEYVAAQNPTDPGVLILSKFAGAAEELTTALIVDPLDGDEIAAAMHAGLTMGLDERRERWEAMRARVWENTAGRFCDVFLKELEAKPLTEPSGRRYG